MRDIRDIPLRRVRKRRGISLDGDKKSQIVNDFVTRLERDHQDSEWAREMRLQRHAKYRMWTDGQGGPWEDSSDYKSNQIFAICARAMDTMHNAVLSQQPIITTKSVGEDDKVSERAENLDKLNHHQLMVEQPGEQIMERIIEAFILDGHYTLHVPWVKDVRPSQILRSFEPLPEDAVAGDYFEELLRVHFVDSSFVSTDEERWDWTVTKKGGTEATIRFYAEEGEDVEMWIEQDVTVFEGPRALVKTWEEVYHPVDAENLQRPGPSNPGGAEYVILLDYPPFDEIERLVDSGYYDQIQPNSTELEGIKNYREPSRFRNYRAMKEQRDDFQGNDAYGTRYDDDLKGPTRMEIYCVWDVGSGKADDVVFTAILETKTLLRAKYLSELCPGKVPIRPFAEATMLPAEGARTGISLIETIEGVHDLTKQMFDQMIDAGTLSSLPFGFYKPTSAVNPETIRLEPGELYPTADPKNDFTFPNIQNSAQNFGINVIGLLEQAAQKVTLEGDLQFGKVPAGGSAALRTLGGIQQVLGQGEARPERLLRRFFMGLRDLWKLMQRQNAAFLPAGKRFRVTGYTTSQDSPYVEIDNRNDVDGEFLYEYEANILNTSRQSLLLAYEQIEALAFSEFAFQTGITTPETAYRLIADHVKTLGQNPEKYFQAPSPASNEPRITAQEAILSIMQGQPPEGIPLEATEEHLAALDEFANNDDDFGLLPEENVEVFGAYRDSIAQRLAQEQQQAQLAAAAQSLGGGPGGQGVPQTPAEGQGQAPIQNQGGELLDESLSGSGTQGA